MGRQRTGSALQRRGRWIARITLHHEPALPSGEFRRVEIAVTRADGREITAAYAKQFSRASQTRYDETHVVPGQVEAPAPTPGSITVQAWVEGWLKQQTYMEATKDLARMRAWLPRTRLAKLPLDQVTPRIIAAWLGEIRRLPSARGKAAAPRTLRNVVDPVARALRFAVFEERLSQDPFAVIPSELRPQAVDADPTKRRARRLTQADVHRLLSCDEIPDDRRVLYLLLVLTGTRMSEGVALRWSDVTPDAPLARLTIAEQWHQRLKARMPTKTDAVREVPVHPELQRVLTWWQVEGWPRWYGRAPKPDDLIVPTRTHRQLASVGKCRRQGAVYREFQADLILAGVTRHRVHDTRHTFVSACADAGCTPEVATRWTHAGRASASAIEIYRTPSWARQSEEMMKLKITCTLGLAEPPPAE